jgi:hypothetical protein
MNARAGNGYRRNRVIVAAFIVAAALSAFIVGLGTREAEAYSLGGGGGGGITWPGPQDSCYDVLTCDECYNVMRAGFKTCIYNYRTRCFEPSGVCICIGKGCSDSPFMPWW